MSNETPRYVVVRELAGFELRDYPPLVLAEIVIDAADPARADGEGFRALAAYIFGKNRGEKQIAMTAPVTRSGGTRLPMTAPATRERAPSGGYAMGFAMPSSFTLDTLPAPVDPRISLRPVPARRLAALRYSGRWTEESFAAHAATLLGAMAREGIQPLGEPIYARYNPPWTPWFLRRNEVLIEVARGG